MVTAARGRALAALSCVALGLAAGCNLLFDIGEGTVAPPDGAVAADAAKDAEVTADAAADTRPPDAATDGGAECELPRGGTSPCLEGQACQARQVIPVPPGDAGTATFKALAAFGGRFYFSTTDAAYSIAPGEAAPTLVAVTQRPLEFLSVADANTIFGAARGPGGTVVLARFTCQLASCAAVGTTYLGDPPGQVVATSTSTAWFRVRNQVTKLDVDVDGASVTRVVELSLSQVGRSLSLRGTRFIVDFGSETAAPTGGVSILDGQALSALLATTPGVPRRLATSCTHAYVTISPSPGRASRLVGAPLDGSAAGADLSGRTYTAPAGLELSGLAVDRSYAWFVEERANERHVRAIPLDAFENGAAPASAVTIDSIAGEAGASRSIELAVTDSHVAVLGDRNLWIVRKYN